MDMMMVKGSGCETGSENFPSMSAEVPLVVPLITTVAPTMDSPVLASVIVPVSVCEKRLFEKSKRKIRISLRIRIQIYHFGVHLIILDLIRTAGY
jgi:hypothetical protein